MPDEAREAEERKRKGYEPRLAFKEIVPEGEVWWPVGVCFKCNPPTPVIYKIRGSQVDMLKCEHVKDWEPEAFFDHLPQDVMLKPGQTVQLQGW